ncbi:MAG: protein kinase, partial [Acidobacteria bacterium]|nr:protein kinase [Acidobacteriota bacterium]
LAKAEEASRPVAASAETATAGGLTLPGGVAGTAGYMSPEQARGAKLDARSDLFSFGAVLYQMATGRAPFAAETPALTFDAILNRTPSEPCRLNPQCPAELQRIVSKALEKDRELRYQSAAEMRSDLKRMQRGSSVSTVVAPVRPRVRLRAALAVAALAAMVLVLVLLLRREAPRVPPRIEYTQLTNFSDSASAAALSPDGRMLVFLRGGAGFGNSATFGQVYVKLLPNGEPLQLTNDLYQKATPTFSLDGSRIVYTAIAPGNIWDTWEVPVLAGQPRLLLPNATGLSWISENQLLFSELKRGVHMALVTSAASRAQVRDIYVPRSEVGMVHRSALSPDGKSVLAVEMDGTGWLPCRLLPFDGSSTGRQVGPPGAQCTSAAWSTDGEWMYFSSNAGGAFHIWRQAYPEGVPEQLTSGASEEEGIAVAPDGKSLLTAVGTRQSSVFLHDAAGERQISSEGFAYLPAISPDTKTLYYLIHTGSSLSYVTAELWAVELATGRRSHVLPGVRMTHYSISPDGRRVLYASVQEDGGGGIWLANLDRRHAPVRLTSGGEYRAFFGAPGEVLFLSGGSPKQLYRMREDGNGRAPVSPDPAIFLVSVSPGGEWAVVVAPAREGNLAKVVNTRTGQASILCDTCSGGIGPGRIGAPMVSWSGDGRVTYLSLRYFGIQSQKTLLLPLPPGAPLPPSLVKARSEADLIRLPGAVILPETHVFPGPERSTYAFSRTGAFTNIYRIILPDD